MGICEVKRGTYKYYDTMSLSWKMCVILYIVYSMRYHKLVRMCLLDMGAKKKMSGWEGVHSN